MNLQQIDTDVLIIGTGIAGLKAAPEVAKLGKQVILVSKSPLGKATNTIIGGGGFACATGSFRIEDHFKRTMDSGRMINDRTLVDCFTKKASSEIKALTDMGLKGEYHLSGFRCQSPFLVGGPMVTRVLASACRGANIGIFENIMITDLIVAEETCRGALGFHKRSGEWYGFRSKAVILATGGAGGIYAQNDNAPGVTGDGYALAMKAGLELLDMEFVQFYPLVYAGSGRARMIILPPFADAGKIVNRQGEDIKEKYRLDKKPIAILSRDQLAQALFREIAQGNGVDGALLLDVMKGDITQLSLPDKQLARYKRKINYDKEPVKIAPVCHHTMGGIPIDAGGRTALKGLYAAGEVTGAIHGANRMGGNAYSEGLVFGGLAAQTAADDIESAPDFKYFKSALDDYAQKWDQFLRSEAKQSNVSVVMDRLKKVLWENAGIVRDEASLKEGVGKLEEIFHMLDSQTTRTPHELCKFVACRNAALTGMAITASAIERKESRGSHYREDFQSEDTDWLKHIHVRMSEERPVVSRITAI